MSVKAVVQARRKLSAFEERFIPDSVAHSLKFLASVRGSEGGWGRVKGAISELRTTALALRVFSKYSDSYLNFGEFEDGLEYLLNHLPIRTSPADEASEAEALTEEVAMVMQTLQVQQQEKHTGILRELSRYLERRQNEDGGWGEETSRVDVTATVINALVVNTTSDLSLKKSLTFLVSAVNDDGGWGPYKDSSTGLVHTAKALTALSSLRYQQKSVLRRAANLLISHQDSTAAWGQEDQADVIYTTASVLTALISSGIETSDATIQRAVRFLFSEQNDDGGWGWAVGDASEVEPTSIVLDTLFEAGSTSYVSLFTAIEVLKSTFEENVALREENQSIQEEIDSRVQKRIRNIIDTKDQLEKRVSQLEKQNQRLSRQQSELERLRYEVTQIQDLRVQQLGVRRLLEQALSLISEDRSEIALENIETVIAHNQLHEDLEVKSILTEMLKDLMRVDSEDKDSFIRYYERQLSRGEVSPRLAENLISYVSEVPVPVSSEVEQQIRLLIDRIYSDDVSVKTVSVGVAPLDLVSSDLEKELQTLSPKTSDRLLHEILTDFPSLTVEDARPYSEFVSDMIGREVSRIQRDRIRRIIEQLVLLKQRIPEEVIIKVIERLATNYE